VTFRDVLNGGDLDLMVADDSSLTGEGSAVVVREITKGSEAVSNQLSVSFETPLSFNGDFSGTLATPLAKYRVQWDTSSNFDSNVQTHDINAGAFLFDEQRIIVASESVSMSGLKPELVHEVQTVTVTNDFTADEAFKLSFRGILTGDIATGSSLSDIASTLEDLLSIDGVEVTANAADATDIATTGVTTNSIFDVKFTKQLGPLPALDSSTATVAVSISGATPFRKEIQTIHCDADEGTMDFSFIVSSDTVTVDFDATPAELKAHLESLSSLSSDNGVTVYAEDGSTTGGICRSVYIYIMFNRELGDLPALVVDSVTDSDATVAVEDDSGRAVKGFNTVAESVSGTFQIQFQGTPTGSMNAAGTANDMRAALELHPDINTVKVTRSRSRRELAVTLSGVHGQAYLECGDSSMCDFAGAEFGTPGTLLYMEGTWYSVLAETSQPALDSTKLYLGNEAGEPATYAGSTSSDIRVFEWAGGFEWTVIMMDLESDLEMLTMFSTDFGVPDAAVEILGKDCDKCVYIPNDGVSSLVPGETYYARLFAFNAMGSSEASNSAVGVPKTIPGPVTD
jgi:hypothetical protein